MSSRYSPLFGCKLGALPFRYLGIPMQVRKLSNNDRKAVEDCFEKRLSGWKGKLLSTGGRLVLINSVLSNLPMFMLSFFKVPCGVLKKMDYYRSRFYWQNEQHKKKYRLAKWEIMCQPKDRGLGSFVLKNGSQIRFWEDTWLGNQPLKHQYPSLFNIHATVAETLSSSPLNVSLRRALTGNKLIEWHNLVLRTMRIRLTEGADMFKWNLHKTGSFTVRLMYKALINNNIRDIWRARLPLKIKIFMWYLKKSVLLTKDNLRRKNQYGDDTCVFCSRYQTI
ncbi:LOW QUALITY PROTEIN: hypothetical protein U9M48_030978 [Paspalum notatum var. saurae]|uniref:Reverse transcriptase zinc-binding domain-containing protein n=1 Tax=Paspalum notatum var. saurae TaxID=547442 RepID=A0AAQ3U6F2_PASNO